MRACGVLPIEGQPKSNGIVEIFCRISTTPTKVYAADASAGGDHRNWLNIAEDQWQPWLR
jgi:hypothetical protein